MTTHVIFLLDESGSMAATANDVRGGFNSYIEQLRSDDNDYRLTVIRFGSTYRPLCKHVELEKAPVLSMENYQPLDNTALYDSIAYTLDEERSYDGTKELPYGQDPVLFIIMTDGEENASKHTTKEQVVAKIARREEAGNWTFVYLGADQDAWALASQLGLSHGNVIMYTSANTNLTFRNLATATTATTTSGLNQTQTFFKSY